jgi:hypothetical protein
VTAKLSARKRPLQPVKHFITVLYHARRQNIFKRRGEAQILLTDLRLNDLKPYLLVTSKKAYSGNKNNLF